jgi:hypothetical protein
LSESVKRALEKIGIPGRDLYDLPTSKKTFPDGCNYRIEISGVERPEVLEALIDERDKRDVPVHRLISMCMGATLLDDREIIRFAELARDAKMEVIVVPGPRPSWDIGRQVWTEEGKRSGFRHRGCDQLNYFISDMMRCYELGIRGVMVTDEGLLWAITELKKIGELPKDIKVKLSVWAGCANPAGAKLIESLGADTFNPVGDLTLPMLASIRKVVNIPMDVYIYFFESFGGSNRFWETPEIARIASPCYFKLEPETSSGEAYKPWTDPKKLAFLAREKVKYAEIIMNLIDKHYPAAKISKQGASDLAIPKP